MIKKEKKICLICQENNDNNDMVKLPCRRHQYCKKCIPECEWGVTYFRKCSTCETYFLKCYGEDIKSYLDERIKEEMVKLYDSLK